MATTPIAIDILETELHGYPDKDFVKYLITGLREGFDTGLTAVPSVSFQCPNLLSAKRDPSTVDTLLEGEVQKGYLLGPFSTPPFESYRINPIGLAEKKFSGKKRLIVDFSAPHENDDHPSINSLIRKEDFSLKYVKIDDAIQKIREFGPGSMLCKTDIVDAFKLIPIHPTLWHLHGVCWKEKFYFYKRLAFGCRSSPKIFDTLSVAICWIAKNNYGLEVILHLLDDFLTVDRPGNCAQRTMALLTHIFGKLKIPLSPPKTIGPALALEYLGIILDSQKMEARLPQEKLTRLRQVLKDFLALKSCTRKQAQRLLGYLVFACRVIPIGRPFISQFISLIKQTHSHHYRVSVDDECRKDLLMWLHFLNIWNGISLFVDKTVTRAADLHLYTDASGTLGYGGFFQGKCFQGRWPSNLECLTDGATSIAFKELFPIVMAAHLWGHAWSRKRIAFHSDNQATVAILNKGRSPSPAINVLMRKLSVMAATHGFAFSGIYIPGIDNGIADALSRFQVVRFKSLAPEAEQPYLTNFNAVWI